MLQSLLLLVSWAIVAIFANYLVRTSRVTAVAINITGLALIVEVFASRGLEGEAFVTRNLGYFALALLGVSFLVGHSYVRSKQPHKSAKSSDPTLSAWCAVLAAPAILLIILRLLDVKSFAAWYVVDINTFRGNEDNSKWLGVASQFRVGDSVGVEAIGGFLVVLQRSSLAIADLLSLLGVRTLSSDLAAVTFSVQLVREVLVLACPLVFLLAGSRVEGLRQRLFWMGPGVILSLTAQLLAFHYGFLSFQVALGLGSVWILLRASSSENDPPRELIAFLFGSVFFLSWLPLRLFLPVFVALSIRHGATRAKNSVRIVLIVLATIVVLPTFRFVFGIHPSRFTGLSYTRSLLAATGGVFAVSQWLVLFTVAMVYVAVSTENKKSRLQIVDRAFMLFVIVVLLADVILSGGLGYGSTKLLFLALVLTSVWASAMFSQGNSRVNRSAMLFVAVSLFMTITAYGTGFSLWGAHLSSLTSSKMVDLGQPAANRLKDPELVINDFGKLNAVLQAKGVCTKTSCSLEDVPRVCLAVYEVTRPQFMHKRPITRVDAITSGPLSLYLCTRFLSEVSYGTAHKDWLQQRFFFADGERLRDSLAELAATSPETPLLVAREGRYALEIRTAAELSTLAWQTYPQVPSCNPFGYLGPPQADCRR